MSKGGARAHTRIDRKVDVEQDALRGAREQGLFAGEEPMLFLVDGNNLLWRAAHGPRAPFPANDGRDLTPLFRFFLMLRRALGSYGLFSECIVCFDGERAWESRVAIDPNYKSNRSYDDADLSFMGWIPEIRAGLDLTGIACVEVEDSEADDVIATLVSRVSPRRVRILSTDRDFYQLISPTVTVVNPKERPALVGAEGVKARYGVTPERWCDFRTLSGDPSDGIPGLPGVGMKKAAAMLDGRTLDELLGSDGSVASRREDLLRWRALIEVNHEAPVAHIPAGETTPKLVSATKVCEGLGLVP